MEERGDDERTPRPGAAPERNLEPSSQLSCDGETFELRPDGVRGTHYRWLSGPNPGYGFSQSPTFDDNEHHLANIRSFLSMVDPATGYIEAE
jgi:hypothetical protein